MAMVPVRSQQPRPERSATSSNSTAVFRRGSLPHHSVLSQALTEKFNSTMVGISEPMLI